MRLQCDVKAGNHRGHLGEGEVDARIALERRLHRLVVHLHAHHCRFQDARHRGATACRCERCSSTIARHAAPCYTHGPVSACGSSGMQLGQAVAASAEHATVPLQGCADMRCSTRFATLLLCSFSDQSPTRLHGAGGLRLRRRQLPVVDGPVQHHWPLPLRHDVHLAGSGIALTHIQHCRAPSTQCHWPETGKKAQRPDAAWRGAHLVQSTRHRHLDSDAGAIEPAPVSRNEILKLAAFCGQTLRNIIGQPRVV